MTYTEAINQGYKEQVDEVRVLPVDYSTRTDWPGRYPNEVEFCASLRFLDYGGEELTITAYYYQSQDVLTENGGELDLLDWDVANYEVV
jgi:hypothetical protein